MQAVEIDHLERKQINAGANARSPLVFLHEGLGSVAAWRSWPQALCVATQRAGWLYSRHGYGRSPTAPGTAAGAAFQPDYLHHEAWVVLPQLLDALGVAQPVLIGHSDGASIALLYASRHPVRACVAMAPHVMVEDVTVAAIAKIATVFEQGDLRTHLARFHDDADSVFWRWNKVWRSQSFRQFDIRPECQRISAPVLAIQGADDPYGSLAQITDINLPASQITRHIWPACGHHPQRDQAALTTRAIVEFLADLS
jgi:pimeloyl-ACP methyl ester carboxylesterase